MTKKPERKLVSQLHRRRAAIVIASGAKQSRDRGVPLRRFASLLAMTAQPERSAF
jgi:hypothetical protein